MNLPRFQQYWVNPRPHANRYSRVPNRHFAWAERPEGTVSSMLNLVQTIDIQAIEYLKTRNENLEKQMAVLELENKVLKDRIREML